jgi:broad specificity phosphatase PhoE
LPEPTLIIVRHGETDWSRSGQHTSRTDLDLTAAGEAQARHLGAFLAGIDFDLIVSSPRRRAVRTAELAGLVPFQVVDDLVEWDYGDLEGLTSPQIQARYPGWSIWVGPCPDGETTAQVSARADRVIRSILSAVPSASGTGRVAVVGHGHFSRVLAARWVGQAVSAGEWLDLDTCTWSELGWVRGSRVIRHWNVPVPASP